MAGTTKHIFGEDTIVSPTGMYGKLSSDSILHMVSCIDVGIANTDTKSMWNLTKNIYRFTPSVVSKAFNVHTVNEVRCHTPSSCREEAEPRHAENAIGWSPEHHSVLLQAHPQFGGLGCLGLVGRLE